jgi:hypothetical protein
MKRLIRLAEGSGLIVDGLRSEVVMTVDRPGLRVGLWLTHAQALELSDALREAVTTPSPTSRNRASRAAAAAPPGSAPSPTPPP